MTHKYPKEYTASDIAWLENVFEPIWRKESRSNSVSDRCIDKRVDVDDIEVEQYKPRFYDCRLMSLGGKRLTTLYNLNVDFSEAAKVLNIKERTLRLWVSRLGNGLRLIGSGRKQVTRMLYKPCHVQSDVEI